MNPEVSTAQRIWDLWSIKDLMALRTSADTWDLRTLRIWGSTSGHPGPREAQVPSIIQDPGDIQSQGEILWALSTQQHLGPLERIWDLVWPLGLAVT